MLKSNLWAQKGLCNGATGNVLDILYATGQRPPNLPIAVLVQFDRYTGPPFTVSNPTCIPIPPISFDWSDGSTRLSRQQLPLMLSYAITIHKSQGQTLSKACIDIGEREKAAGATFVALSRLRQLSDGIIQPMPFERLQSIGRLKWHQERMLEEETFWPQYEALIFWYGSSSPLHVTNLRMRMTVLVSWRLSESRQVKWLNPLRLFLCRRRHRRKTKMPVLNSLSLMNRCLKHLLRQISTSSHSQHPEEHLSTSTHSHPSQRSRSWTRHWPKWANLLKRASRGRHV